MFKQPNIGDIIVSAKRGFIFTQKLKTKKRSFGSLNTDHLLLPLLINCKTKQRIRRPTDIYKAIAILQGFMEDPETHKHRDAKDDRKRKSGKRKYHGQRDNKRSGTPKQKKIKTYKKNRD